MRYFVYAYDTVYYGMHGIYDVNVFDDADYAEPWDRETLNDVGIEMAREVINSFAGSPDLSYDLPEEEDFDNEDDFEEAYIEAMNELCGWDIYVIKPEFDDVPTAELRENASTYGPEYFVHKYCVWYEG